VAKVAAAQTFRKFFSLTTVAATYADKVAGTRAIGLDRVDARNFAAKVAPEILLISKKVLAGTYLFTKFKQKLVSRGAGKAPRILSIPTIRDRVTLRVLCDFLFVIFPEAKPALPQKKIDDLQKAIDTGGYENFVKIDLRDFYPSLDHKLILSRLRTRVRLSEFIALIRAAITTSTVAEANAKPMAPNVCGVAQGLSISNVLAEIFMIEVDKKISALAPVYFRYVDDILILTNANPATVCAEVCQILRKSRLHPHPLGAPHSKTRVGKVADQIDFLGYSLRPKTVSVRESSVLSFEGTLVDVFTEYKHRLRMAKDAAEKAIHLARFRWALNLKLTGCIYKEQRFGWVFYYSQINDLSVLRRIDHTVRLLLKRFNIDIPPNPKRTLKAFYESKRTAKDTHWYIPNYDLMTVPRMRKFLSELGYKVDNFPDQEVTFVFGRLVRRATRGLEKDVANMS
jgi:RNA-directed DNA polymerase